MTLKSLIDLGNVAGDGLGNPLRTGGVRLNNVWSQTYVASATQFGGTTNDQIVQNTITAAVADGAKYVYVPASLLPYTSSLVTFNTGVRMLCEGGDPSLYEVRAYGTTGDATDATVAMNAAGAAAYAAGGGTVVANANGIYLISRRVLGSQVEGGILMRPNVNWDFRGAELRLADNCSFLVGTSADTQNTDSTGAEFSVKATVTADVAYAATTVTVNSNAGFVVGDDVFLRLGEDAVDNNESTFWMFAKVGALPAGQITLDRPILNAVTVAAVTNVGNKRVYRITPGNLLQNIVVQNVYFNNPETGAANAEAGANLRIARDIVLRNVRGRHVGAGVVLGQYCDNVWGYGLNVPECNAQSGAAAKGRVASFGTCINCGVDGVDAANLDNQVVVSEFHCKGIEARNVQLAQTKNSGTPSLFSATNDAELSVRNLSIFGYGGFALYNIANGGVFRAENVSVRLTSEPTLLGRPDRDLHGAIRYRIGASTDELYRSELARWSELMIPLNNSMSGQNFFLDYGVLCAFEVFTSAGVDTVNDIPAFGFMIGRSSDNGGDFRTSLVAGQLVRIETGALTGGLGTDAGALNTYRNERLKILISTAGSGLTGQGKFLLVRALLVPKDSLTRTFTDLQAQYQRKDVEWLQGEATFDPTSLNTGIGQTTTISVTGAALGDYAEATFSLDLQGIAVTAWVSSSNTVSVRLQNQTGGTLDLASGTLRVRVSKLRP